MRAMPAVGDRAPPNISSEERRRRESGRLQSTANLDLRGVRAFRGVVCTSILRMLITSGFGNGRTVPQGMGGRIYLDPTAITNQNRSVGAGSSWNFVRNFK
ncbi:hypothetical protein CEXT_350271 [Caerostris extrusa]|uniref:Uncharacterized protein n=1 Tax=Caerostris extrusa TaxID=172846 RepID=A0AAV4Y1U8_CAEEX|nr:hypothetical protein CEXT_350271 [Caerostris extrusa]